MENEKNRGLIDKEAFEDQLERFFSRFFSGLVNVTFCQFNFGALILFSLSVILLST